MLTFRDWKEEKLMRNFYLFFCVLCALLGISVITGCSPREEVAVGTKKLVVWLVGSEGQAQSINELGKEFAKEKGEDIIVNCDSVSWGEAHSKYLTSIAGGVVPDVGMMGLTWGTEFGTLGAMVNLAEEYSEDLNQMKKDIFPGMWESIEYKGMVFGIPFDLSEQIMYYRSDIVEKPPRTWEELINLLVILNAQDKGMIFDWGSVSWIGLSPFLWQAGGDFYNEAKTEVTLDTPQAKEAFTFFTELYTKYYVPKTSIPVEQGMRTGDFPLAISGNWKIDGLRLGAPEIAGKWRIAELPKGPSGKRTTFIGGRIMGIFKQSKNKDLALEFVKFLFRPEIQVKLYTSAQEKQDTYLPPNMETWRLLPMDPEFRNVLKAQALDAKGPPSVLSWEESTLFIDQAIQKIILEGRNVDQEVIFADSKVEENLSDR